jgi:DNA-binding CsgD family transcriptional regulator
MIVTLRRDPARLTLFYAFLCNKKLNKRPAAMENKFKLTKREIQLLEMFREGKTSSECAKELYLSYFTVETHRKNIHHKLGTHKLINAISIYTAFLLQNFS